MTRKLKLGIKDLPSLQQFVDFDVTRDVSSVLISQITSGKNSYSSLLTVNKSEHLALTRRHAAQLTFHTGLRIDELINLRVTDIIEDDGPTLFVRKSKTNNGKRYLPGGVHVLHKVQEVFTVQEQLSLYKQCISPIRR
jgi:integrase